MSMSKTSVFLENIGQPEMMKCYLEMKSNPAFALVAGAVADMRASQMITDPSGDKALQQNGFRAGVASALELLLHADDYAVVDTGDEARVKSQVKYLVEVEGYSASDAAEMVEKEQ